MRKFLIRWWYTSNYEQDRTRQAIEEWQEARDQEAALESKLMYWLLSEVYIEEPDVQHTPIFETCHVPTGKAADVW